MQLWIGQSHHEKKVKIELIQGRGQSGHGAVVQMGGWGTLRQRVTDTCTGDRIFKCARNLKISE